MEPRDHHANCGAGVILVQFFESDVAFDQALATVPIATTFDLPTGDCVGMVLAADARACADQLQTYQANAYLPLDPGSAAMAAGVEIDDTHLEVDAWAH